MPGAFWPLKPWEHGCSVIPVLCFMAKESEAEKDKQKAPSEQK